MFSIPKHEAGLGCFIFFNTIEEHWYFNWNVCSGRNREGIRNPNQRACRVCPYGPIPSEWEALSGLLIFTVLVCFHTWNVIWYLSSRIIILDFMTLEYRPKEATTSCLSTYGPLFLFLEWKTFKVIVTKNDFILSGRSHSNCIFVAFPHTDLIE